MRCRGRGSVARDNRAGDDVGQDLDKRARRPPIRLSVLQCQGAEDSAGDTPVPLRGALEPHIHPPGREGVASERGE